MKKNLLLLFYFLNIALYAQNLQDLKKRLLTETDREKIETYLDISGLNISRDTTIFYLNNALKAANKINFDSIYEIQFALCVSYYVKGDLVNAKKEIKKGFNSYKYTKDPDGTNGHINMLLGVFNEAMNEIDSAKYYYNNVIGKLKNKKSNKSIEILSSTYTNYANLYLKSGKYDKAIEIYLKAEKMSASIGENKNRIVSLNNIAACYKEIKQYDKALVYYNNALNIAIESKDNQNIGSVNLGVGEIYTLQGDFDNALVHYLKAEKNLKSIGFKRVLYIAYQNIAQVYLNKKEHSKAKVYSEKALAGIDLIKDDFTKTSIFLTHANVLEEDKKYNEAINIIDKAISLSRDNKYQNLLKESITEKIKILKKIGKSNKLTALYDELLILKDSLLNKENFTTISNIETKYQTEKKEKENLQLKADNIAQELQLEKENKRKQYFAYGLLASLFTLGIFGFYYRRNQKQKTVIENLQKDLHHRVKNNLAIIDSLVEDIKDEFDNKQFTSKLTDLQNRIDSINEVHSQLYMSSDITNLKFKKYIEKLAKNVQQSFAKENVTINNSIDDSFTLNVEQSFPIGLIINEFLTNSFKYAFTDTEKGIVNIAIQEESQNYILSLSDNGKGLPDDFDSSKLDSFGMDVMRLLSKQLKGSFSLKGTNGVHLTINFPKA